jgi:hypothetical protein
MSDVEATPFGNTLQWLSHYARFPTSRLPVKAETLLLIAAAAAAEEAAAATPRFGLDRRDGPKDAALRAHALRRSAVHFKCDNSAKV